MTSSSHNENIKQENGVKNTPKIPTATIPSHITSNNSTQMVSTKNGLEGSGYM